MAISIEKRVAFLQAQQIFNETDPDLLPQIAERLEEYTLTKNSNLFTEGEAGNHFYFIYSGVVQLWQEMDGEVVSQAILGIGDKFGEESLLLQQPRVTTATAKENCHFLSLDYSDFNWMINQFPAVKENLIALAFSHQQSRINNFDWLHENETIYLLNNRHPISLWIGLLQPIAIITIGLFLYFFAHLIPSLPILPTTVGILLLIAGILWAVWEGIDWKNDFFIITNQRVIWLEKVLFQSDSRQEAPLSAVQSINVHTTFLGRLLDYGVVTVRTFTGLGSLTLTNISNPNRFKDNIQEQLIRLRDKGDSTSKDKIKHSISQVLGIETDEPVKENAGFLSLDQKDDGKQKVFAKRQISGDIITYHKHWLIFLKTAWIVLVAGLFSVTSLIFLILNALIIGNSIENQAIILLGIGTLLLISISVIAYHYVDWKNDIYKLTADSIVDSEHKPFGNESTQIASIKNIQSIENNRKGLLRLIFNYGSVNIMIADALFTFIDVPFPAQVQQDIYYRQEQLKLNEKEETIEGDRIRMADMIQAYHEIQNEQQKKNQPNDPSYPALENEED